MTTATATSLARPARAHHTHSSLAPLARIELARLARHPMLVFGVLFGIASTAISVEEITDKTTGDVLGMPVTALTVGLPAMISAHLLARSFDRADELVESAPTSRVTRTGAMCFAALVPAVIASGWLVLYAIAERWLWTTPEWLYGTLSHADVWAIIIGNTVVAAIGGTLLGIAAGRWWRFRGSSVALVLGVVTWTIGVIGLFSLEGTPAPWHRWVRLFTPVNAFSNPAPDGNGADTLTGSPMWYLGWLVSLCALAAIAALLKGSERPTHGRLVRLGAVVLLASVVTYGLAAAGGNSHSVRTYPDGHSVVLTP
jgi:hypothetical protein